MFTLTRIKARVHLPQALRYREYRLFWTGQLCSVLGFQMLQVTQGWLVYDITGSTLQLGLVGLFSAVPAILLNLFGGVAADKVDQRRLIMATQATGAVVLAILATLVLTDLVQPWHVMALAFVIGGLGAFDQPARQAIFPRLIERPAMMNAVALNAVVWQWSRILGPALAGVLIVWVGAAITFYLAAVGFAIFVLFLSTMRVPAIERPPSSNVLRDMVAGLAFIRDNHIFTFLMGMTFINSFFGMSYIHLMPVFQKNILNVDPSGLGLLLAAGGVGGVLGTVIVLNFGNVRRHGLLLITGAVAFGFFLALFANSRWFMVSLVLLALAGASNSIFVIIAQGMLHMLVPDHFRGRVMGFWNVTYNLVPLGGFQAGVVASIFSAPVAVTVGGVAVVAFALLGAARNPRIRGLGTQPVAT